MKYVFGLPKDEEVKEVVSNYYNFYEESYGRDPLSFYTKKHFDIENPSIILKADENFKRSTETLNELYSVNNIALFRLFDDDGKLLALSRFKIDLNNRMITVGEIVLTPNVITEDREFVFAEVIEYLENYFLSHNIEIINDYNDGIKTDIVRIKIVNFEVPKYKEDSIEYINALLSYDYTAINEPNSVNSQFLTNIFTKNIRRKPQMLDIKQLKL